VNLPPDPERFFRLVWAIVRQVPRGMVTTYGQIASMIPPPQGVEAADYDRLGPVWVGKAMNAVSSVDETAVPWQRVINSQGGISLPEGSRAAIEQRRRLENEGVEFDAKGRANLNRWGWDGPADDWLREMKLRPPRPIRKPEDPQQMTLF
jgi:methylated-DNA-protein-cysteine methyltransferase-like protein